MCEVDYYAWIPAGSHLQNHRLSLRKNLKTGKYEVYRRFFSRYTAARRGLVISTGVDMHCENVVFSGESLEEAIDFAHKECVKFHGKSNRKDEVCQHEYPTKATRCEGKKMEVK